MPIWSRRRASTDGKRRSDAFSQEEERRISASLDDNLIELRKLFSNSSDFMVREISVAGQRIALLMCEAMVSTAMFTELIVKPLTGGKVQLQEYTPQGLADWIRYRSYLGNDQKELFRYKEIFSFIMSGFVVILIDGLDVCFSLGIQGYSFRSISEPDTEVNVRGSKEGFTEPIRVNMSLIRRRIKSPTLKFELLQTGKRSGTDICLVYLTDIVSPKILREIQYRLSKVDLDILLDSGYLRPYFDSRRRSIFSGIGSTERPDVLCGKISEGRVGILVDGTPFALIIPYLFNENFQSLDDYCYRPFYATFIRILRYCSFLISIYLPGLYVAIATFHPEFFPEALLFNIAAAEESTPFPLMIEAVIIHLIFEIMREAGLRLPRPVGHAVGIVGALVVGDAAVTAGLIGSPMVMVVALTAISSFVVPSIYEPVTIMRFSFILAGGFFGIFGITVASLYFFISLSAVNIYGVVATSPVSPFQKKDMRDVFTRVSWKKLSRRTMEVQNLPGSEVQQREP